MDKRVIVSLELPKDLKIQLDIEAKALDMSVSAVIRQAIRQYLSNKHVITDIDSNESASKW